MLALVVTEYVWGACFYVYVPLALHKTMYVYARSRLHTMRYLCEYVGKPRRTVLRLPSAVSLSVELG